MVVVQITGKKQAGKNTLASILREKLEARSYRTADLAYADPIKSILARTFGITVAQLEGAKEAKGLWSRLVLAVKHRDPVFMFYNFRVVMQRFGTEIMQGEFGENVWVEKAHNRLANLRSSDVQVAIITDWRFPQETILNALKVRIIDPRHFHDKDLHKSETHNLSASVDIEVVNSGSIEKLEREAGRAVSEIIRLVKAEALQREHNATPFPVN